MAKIGYLFCTKNNKTLEEDRQWMLDYGCENIIEEDGTHEKLRPHWRKMLGNIKRNDTIVVTKLSHSLRGIRELGTFLDLCQSYKLRLISIHDKIDTAGELYPQTTASDVLAVIGKLSSEINSLRRSETRAFKLRKDQHARTLKANLKCDREKTIVKMYNANCSIEEIWKASGYKSRTSVFRVLSRNGVKLNRGHFRGTKNRED